MANDWALPATIGKTVVIYKNDKSIVKMKISAINPTSIEGKVLVVDAMKVEPHDLEIARSDINKITKGASPPYKPNLITGSIDVIMYTLAAILGMAILFTGGAIL